MFRNFFFFFIQKHSFPNIFNIFKFHRVILFNVISSRDLMDYLKERVRIFNFILTMAQEISPPSLRGFDEITVVGHSEIPFDETERRRGRRGGGTRTAGDHLLERFLIEKMDVRGRAIGDVPVGIFNGNFFVVLNSVVVFISSRFF